MLFLYLYNSVAYRIVKSPITTDWAFLWILHVPRLLLEQCSTVLISPGEQSDQPYGLKKRLQKPLFSGSGSTCSGTGIRLFSSISDSLGGIAITSAAGSGCTDLEYPD